MSRRRFFELLLMRWGFALLVALAITIGLIAAVTATPPADVPSVALDAAVVYRVEIGVAVFLGLYLAVMAFALALRNRGFTEIGTDGVRARDLATDSREEIVFMDAVADLVEEAGDLRTRRKVINDGR